VNYSDSNLGRLRVAFMAIIPAMNKLEQRAGIEEMKKSCKISVGKSRVKTSLSRSEVNNTISV
jgi:hypothetical protein